MHQMKQTLVYKYKITILNEKKLKALAINSQQILRRLGSSATSAMSWNKKI